MVDYLCAMPNGTDSDGIFELFLYLNNNNCVGGILFGVILLIIYGIILVTTMFTIRPSKAFAFTNFITLILAIPLAVADLLNVKYVYMLILLLAIGVFWVKLDTSE